MSPKLKTVLLLLALLLIVMGIAYLENPADYM